MPNIELVRAISICYNMFKFRGGLNHYLLRYRVHRQTDKRTDRQTHTDRQTDMSTL